MRIHLLLPLVLLGLTGCMVETHTPAPSTTTYVTPAAPPPVAYVAPAAPTTTVIHTP